MWRILLDVSCDRKLAHTLPPDELARAERFRFERDRRRFTVARGSLRAILGRYLGVPPGGLRFEYGHRGKPRLAEDTGGTWLRFNLAHSHGRALCAVAAHREVGIDLERLVPDRENEVIAEQLFAPAEITALRAVPRGSRSEIFYRCWTQKEAYVKAIGDGLHIRLDEFEVSLAPGEPLAVLSTRGASHDASRWSLHALDPWPAHAAALAVEGHDVRITCREWSHDPPPRVKSPGDVKA